MGGVSQSLGGFKYLLCSHATVGSKAYKFGCVLRTAKQLKLDNTKTQCSHFSKFFEDPHFGFFPFNILHLPTHFIFRVFLLPVHVSALCCFHFPLHTIKVFYPLFLTPVRLLGIRGVAFRPTQSEKKKKDSHKKGKVKEVKELKVSHKIGQHDYDVRVKQARKFLEGGHRIKVPPPPNDVARLTTTPHSTHLEVLYWEHLQDILYWGQTIF